VPHALVAAILSLALAGASARAGEAQHEPKGDEGAELVRQLRAIIEAQRQIEAALPNILHPPCDHTFQPDPLIADAPAVVLRKGESATVRHAINWREFPDDKLRVAIASSDKSLRVPAELSLDFEEHQFRFEYAITAGDKTGEFIVTLTPAAGKVVTVKVIVQ
jgi:hypothetical protein